VLVIGARPLPDAVAVEQHAGDPCILAGQDVGGGQGLQRAQRDVAEIADRRRHQIERGIQRPRGDFRLPDHENLLAVLSHRQPVSNASLPCRCTRCKSSSWDRYDFALASDRQGTKSSLRGYDKIGRRR
jgi:hypothetical protein